MQPNPSPESEVLKAIESELALLGLANLRVRTDLEKPSINDLLRLLDRDHPVASQAARECLQRLFQAKLSTARNGVDDEHGFSLTPPPNGKPVQQLVRELLLGKGADGLSRRYIETLRSHLQRFCCAFDDRPISSVKVGDIEQWLRGLQIGPRSRNNIRASIITLFRFAQKHSYLRRGILTEADEVAKAKERTSVIGILSPEELQRALSCSAQNLGLFLALGAFTGMRSSEILRLEWSDVNFHRGHIVVAAHKAKTATRRLVPILPNLREFLNPYRHMTGPVFQSRHTANQAIATAKACHIAWPNNALRHSYATYRLALTADAARVALEMGNSPQKLMTNYRELADPEDAGRWFSIVPSEI